MPRIKFTETMTDCDCDDGRVFDLGPMERKHVTAEDGDVWCCVILAADPQKPRPLFPISGAAKTEYGAKLTAKAKAKAERIARAAVMETFETKKAELKAKVIEGGNLSNDDVKDLLTLWVQL